LSNGLPVSAASPLSFCAAHPFGGRVILGVVLAGGSSRRFAGGNKALARLGARPLLGHVLERARPQVTALAISGAEPALAAFGIPVIPDAAHGAGPLSGILASLAYAAHDGFREVATFPCDTPFFPPDVVLRLRGALKDGDADCALARSGMRDHGVFGLWPVRSRARLSEAFAAGARSFYDVKEGLRVSAAEMQCADAPGGDPLFNINTAADLAAAEAWLLRRT
jgi:molybdopterin-guanine dinucleotide biosynthesis protein A